VVHKRGSQNGREKGKRRDVQCVDVAEEGGDSQNQSNNRELERVSKQRGFSGSRKYRRVEGGRRRGMAINTDTLF